MKRQCAGIVPKKAHHMTCHLCVLYIVGFGHQHWYNVSVEWAGSHWGALKRSTVSQSLHRAKDNGWQVNPQSDRCRPADKDIGSPPVVGPVMQVHVLRFNPNTFGVSPCKHGAEQ